MNFTRHTIRLACAAALLLTACTSSEEPASVSEVTTACVQLRLGVTEMTMTPATRALSPMDPDIEKYVKQAAIFEFDNEGLHEKGESTYHFVDFVEGKVDGKVVEGIDHSDFGIVETTLKELKFIDYDNGTICVVGNITEDQVEDLYQNYREPGQSYGRLTLDKFKTWSLEFDYEKTQEGVYDETKSGHLKEMYMFGYYQGAIDPANTETIAVDLGRLASRLDITIINETDQDIEKRFGYHFDNACHSAYFFPIKMGMPATIGVGLSRTIICSGIDDPVEGAKHSVPETFTSESPNNTHTRYFYVAAHSAKNESEATKLHLFYNGRIVDDDKIADPTQTKDIQIPLCNVHPDLAGSVKNGYSLSRNTRYHFTIRLKKKGDAPAGQVMTRAGAAGNDITVYFL